MRIADCGLRIGIGATTAACAGLVALLSGCGKELVITQGQYINTAMHVNRQEQDQTGEPLELNVVYVYPETLKHDANGRLAPESGITADIWFRDRPQPGDTKDMAARGTRFWLPKEQILLLTDDSQFYGTRVGGRPRGAHIDGNEVVLKRKLDFKGSLGSDRSVIYVFPKFVDSKGQVLPVRPAKFHPPSAYDKELTVRIGVDKSRDNYGQRIDASGRK
jgi:hypothetical protein